MGRSKPSKLPYTAINIRSNEPTIPKEPSFLSHLFSRQSILARLVFSLIPPFGTVQKIATDYEGSALNLFLLFCVLYNRLGRLGTRNPLISAMFLPISYVSIFSAVILGIKSFTKTNISLREVVCMTSYGLFGHTITLVLSILSPRLFIPSLILFGGLCSLRICNILLLRTRLPPLRFVVCTPATIAHLLFLVYLHVTVTG